MTPLMDEFPIRKSLPQTHSLQIGRITTKYARLEWELRKTLYTALDIGAKEGRQAVISPRAQDYIPIIQNILVIRKISAPRIDVPKIKKFVEKIKKFRDALAHGVWIKHSATRQPVLQVVSGAYSPMPGAKKVSAKIHPQAVIVTAQNLRDIAKGIDIQINNVRAWRKEIAGAINALQQKHPLLNSRTR